MKTQPDHVDATEYTTRISGGIPVSCLIVRQALQEGPGCAGHIYLCVSTTLAFSTCVACRFTAAGCVWHGSLAPVHWTVLYVSCLPPDRLLTWAPVQYDMTWQLIKAAVLLSVRMPTSGEVQMRPGTVHQLAHLVSLLQIATVELCRSSLLPPGVSFAVTQSCGRPVENATAALAIGRPSK